MISREEAKRRLTNRWNEQVERWPLMRKDIPLELYVRQNLPHVLKSWRDEPLEKYK